MLVSVLLLRSKMNDGRASERWFGIASSYCSADEEECNLFLAIGLGDAHRNKLDVQRLLEK